MRAEFFYPVISQVDDIRGTTKTVGVVSASTDAMIVISDSTIDKLVVEIPDDYQYETLTISAVVKIWDVSVSSKYAVIAPPTLELDLGSSIELVFVYDEDCWVVVRSM